MDRIFLLTTIAHTDDGRVFYLQNAIIADSHVENDKKSKHYSPTIQFELAFDTPIKFITVLREKVKKFLAEHSKEFTDECVFSVLEGSSPDTIKISVFVETKFQWHEVVRCSNARTELWLYIRKWCSKLGLKNVHPVQKIQFSVDSDGISNLMGGKQQQQNQHMQMMSPRK